MKRLLWALAGLAVGAVVFWPAASFEAAAQRALPAGSRVSLSGSVWNGHGVIGLNGATLPLEWRFVAASLADLRLGWGVESRSTPVTARVELSLGLGGVEISNPQFDGDVSMLAALAPVTKLAGLKGRVVLESADSLRLRPEAPWHAEGQGTLVLQEMVVAALSASPTGTHRVDVKGLGPSLAFELKKSEGPLTLEGKGTLNNRNELNFSGSALPLSTLEPEARAHLARWAPLQSDGRYRIEVKTKW